MKQKISLFKPFYAAIIILMAMALNTHAQTTEVAPTPLKIDPIDYVEVSLLTCEPHDAIYSLYGHTAIRLEDRANGRDVAINFGVFDFRSDYFVARFVFGLTDYMMGVVPFRYFVEEYQAYGSGVYQQRIRMTREEKLRFMRLLSENARPENSTYRYNYFYNNCTTKARDLIYASLDSQPLYEATELQTDERSFRELIHIYNDNHRWARLGNDLLLGVKADANTVREERQFLPAVMAQDLDVACRDIDGRRTEVVDTAFWVLPPQGQGISVMADYGGALMFADHEGVPTPMGASMVLVCAIVALVVCQVVRGKWWPWVNYGVCCLYALPGLVLVVMIFSKHPTVSLNLQLLVFNPLLLWLSNPRCRWRWRWNVLEGMTVAGILAGLVQSYGEGVGLLAWCLLLVVIVSRFKAKKAEMQA